MKLKQLLNEKDLKDTMSMLRRVKEKFSPKDEYIFRKLVYVAAHMSGLDGLRDYSWFLNEFERWLNSNLPMTDFFYIEERLKRDNEFYRVKVKTILLGNFAELENELYIERNKAMDNDCNGLSFIPF